MWPPRPEIPPMLGKLPRGTNLIVVHTDDDVRAAWAARALIDRDGAERSRVLGECVLGTVDALCPTPDDRGSSTGSVKWGTVTVAPALNRADAFPAGFDGTWMWVLPEQGFASQHVMWQRGLGPGLWRLTPEGSEWIAE